MQRSAPKPHWRLPPYKYAVNKHGVLTAELSNQWEIISVYYWFPYLPLLINVGLGQASAHFEADLGMHWAKLKVNLSDSKESGHETSTGVILVLWTQNLIEEVLQSQDVTCVCYFEKEHLVFPDSWWFKWSGTEIQSNPVFWVWQTDVISWKPYQNLEKCKWCRGKECKESVLPPSPHNPADSQAQTLYWPDFQRLGWGCAQHLKSGPFIQICKKFASLLVHQRNLIHLLSSDLSRKILPYE